MPEFRGLGRRDPSGLQTVGFDAAEFHEGAQQFHSFFREFVTVQVTAFPDVSAADKDPVHPLLKGEQDVVGRDTATAHDPNHTDVGRVLQPTDPSQVSSRVCSPGAEKADDLWLEILGVHKVSFFFLTVNCEP